MATNRISSPKLDNRGLEKTFPGLMSHDFCGTFLTTEVLLGHVVERHEDRAAVAATELYHLRLKASRGHCGARQTEAKHQAEMR